MQGPGSGSCPLKGGGCRGYDLGTLGCGFKLFQGEMMAPLFTLLRTGTPLQCCWGPLNSASLHGAHAVQHCVGVRTLRPDFCSPGPHTGRGRGM